MESNDLQTSGCTKFEQNLESKELVRKILRTKELSFETDVEETWRIEIRGLRAEFVPRLLRQMERLCIEQS
jgi:hypothetical protein